MPKTTVTAYCPAEQADTEHSLIIDGTGEIVMTCMTQTGTEEAPATCGSFFKLPKGSTVADIKAFLVQYKASNEGQIPVASIEGLQDELINGLNEGV